jgi:hypothetical protein
VNLRLNNVLFLLAVLVGLRGAQGQLRAVAGCPVGLTCSASLICPFLKWPRPRPRTHSPVRLCSIADLGRTR